MWFWSFFILRSHQIYPFLMFCNTRWYSFDGFVLLPNHYQYEECHIHLQNSIWNAFYPNILVWSSVLTLHGFWSSRCKTHVHWSCHHYSNRTVWKHFHKLYKLLQNSIAAFHWRWISSTDLLWTNKLGFPCWDYETFRNQTSSIWISLSPDKEYCSSLLGKW